MSVWSAKVMRAKKCHRCDSCDRLILPGRSYLRLYGNSERYDPPTTLYLHLKCEIGIMVKGKIADEFKRKEIWFTMDVNGILEAIEEPGDLTSIPA